MAAQEGEGLRAKMRRTGALPQWIRRINVKLQALVEGHHMNKAPGTNGIQEKPVRPDAKAASHEEEIHKEMTGG
jgi:hypothetical protein